MVTKNKGIGMTSRFRIKSLLSCKSRMSVKWVVLTQPTNDYKTWWDIL
jgi:hypothetical protein